MVLAGIDFPPDVRVQKEASSLLEAGHRIALLCSDKKGRQARSFEGAISVSRVAARRAGIARLLDSLTTYMSFRMPRWAREIRLWARDERVDVLHCHDLKAAPTVLDVGELLGIPVVVDLHENYPAAMRVWREPTTAQRVFRTAHRYPNVELAVARRAERIVVVVPEASARFIVAGIPETKLVVVSNTEPLSFGDEVATIPRDPRFGDDIVLAYAGGFDRERGLELVVSAMPDLLAADRPYRLVLAGDGEMSGELEALAESLGVADRVEFPGWVDAAGVKNLIASADVCLVPHRKSEHTDTTVPHKLFQYMVSRRAVAVSDCAPLRRIVTEAGCGVVVGEETPAAWASALRSLSDKDVAARLGAAGRAACETTYNWAVDGARLVEMYATMGRR